MSHASKIRRVRKLRRGIGEQRKHITRQQQVRMAQVFLFDFTTLGPRIGELLNAPDRLRLDDIR